MENNNALLKLFVLLLIPILPILIVFIASDHNLDKRLSSQQLAQVGSSILNGLINYYTFDEGSGTLASDSVGLS